MSIARKNISGKHKKYIDCCDLRMFACAIYSLVKQGAGEQAHPAAAFNHVQFLGLCECCSLCYLYNVSSILLCLFYIN